MRNHLFAALGVFLLFGTPVHEKTVYTDPGTGFSVVIEDDEDILTDAEEKLLLQEMRPVTEYGNAAFVSTTAYESTGSYARKKYAELFGEASGTLFVVDFGSRNIWIHSNGTVYKTITKAYANTITDNVYLYASRGEYYRCAAEVFRQEYTLLEGGRIARPMKHITNALIALITALLGNFLFLSTTRKQQKPDEETVTPAQAVFVAASGTAVLLKTKKRTKPSESSYSGGSSHGGSSGGGGGGGSSGGGGGHRF